MNWKTLIYQFKKLVFDCLSHHKDSCRRACCWISNFRPSNPKAGDLTTQPSCSLWLHVEWGYSAVYQKNKKEGTIIHFVCIVYSISSMKVMDSICCNLQVVPCVEGIYFKDLKQTLKKEQCDVCIYILISLFVCLFLYQFIFTLYLSLLSFLLFA